MKIHSAMKWFAVTAVVAVGLAQAGRREAPVARHWDRTQGGGIDLRPRLVQGSVFTGTTNTGTRPEIAFWARNVSDDTVQAVAQRLAESATFADEQGRAVAAAVKVGPSPMPSYSHQLSLSPAEPLRADAWYTLSVERDLALVVGGPEDRLEDLQGSKQVRFFTGSAPQVRRIIRTADPGKPMQLDVVMSEPVELGSLVREGARVELGHKVLAGCITWDSGCVRADSTRRTNAFSFVPAQPLRGVQAVDLALSFGAGVRGEARTVEAGAAVANLALDRSSGQPRHVVAVAAQAWSQCLDSADVQCWKSAR